jgi:glyoxylase-like metal-dependent hydrolase (beta-lactamase superfamily II)
LEYVSANGPLFERSAIIEGETELALIDTQFTTSNALRLTADLLERGKPLRWVYVTHPHLDHFNGAMVLRQIFSDAKFYAQAVAIPEFSFMVATRQSSLGASAPGGAPNLPAVAPDFFQACPNLLTLDSEACEVLTGRGDHPLSSAVWFPKQRTLVTGDVVFSRTHAFVGDHRDFAGWLRFLQQLLALEPRRVIVGHSQSREDHGKEVILEHKE